MKFPTRHITKTAIAGIVALLPIAGIVLSVVYLEFTLSESWLSQQPWYFPGMGILAAALLVYGIGLLVSNVLGKWFIKGIDRLLDRLPALGALYQTVKQILGYGEGADAMFRRVVYVPSRDIVGRELGLVTNEFTEADGGHRTVVFVPFAPTPTSGRVIVVDSSVLTDAGMPVSEAFKALISVGMVESLAGEAAGDGSTSAQDPSSAAVGPNRPGSGD